MSWLTSSARVRESVAPLRARHTMVTRAASLSCLRFPAILWSASELGFWMLTTLYKKLGEPEKAMDNTEQEFDLLAGTGMTEEEAAADAAATAREAQAAEDKRKEEAEMQASRRRAAAAGAGGAGAGTSDGEEEGSDGAREDGSDEEDAKSIEQEVVYVPLCWWCGIACASFI